jgi:hypothetical protein
MQLTSRATPIILYIILESYIKVRTYYTYLIYIYIKYIYLFCLLLQLLFTHNTLFCLYTYIYVMIRDCIILYYYQHKKTRVSFRWRSDKTIQTALL